MKNIYVYNKNMYLKYIFQILRRKKMRLNETKMQIKMGEQEMNIRMLAEKSGVSRQTISCIKAGKSCSPVVAYKLAEALGMSMEEILNQ